MARQVEDVDLGGTQVASLAEALGIDPMTLDATESLSQFTDLLMSPDLDIGDVNHDVEQGITKTSTKTLRQRPSFLMFCFSFVCCWNFNMPSCGGFDMS